MNSRRTLQLLRDYECRNVTFVEADGSWPIVWKRAKGVHVWDADGKKYLDLTAAFGVAAAGHANSRVVRAGRKQMAVLLHAMGDVHPQELKARLARELSRITFERWKADRGKSIFCNSGFEAVEAGLKTAMLATGRRGIIAFSGGYHGVGYGALNATYRKHFRRPFRQQLKEFGRFVAFPNTGGPDSLRKTEVEIETVLERNATGAVLVEPIQVRGGINIPPQGFLKMLRRLCDRHKALLIFDEIYTGFGRTGKWFGCEHESVVPDVICLGKALTGGFPLSACVGKAEVMDRAWPAATGEAIHTSTFLGHPVGCAMALAQIEEIMRGRLVNRSAAVGEFLLDALNLLPCKWKQFSLVARGLGLLAGLEIRLPNRSPATAVAIEAVKRLLRNRFIVLPEGEYSNVISFTPPLTISESQLRSAVKAVVQVLSEIDVELSQ